MRATREITVNADGVEHKIEIYTALNGFEKQEMSRIMTEGSTFDPKNPEDVKMDGDAVMKGQAYLVKALIAGVDGDKNDPYNKVMNMHSDLYDAVALEVIAIMNEAGKKKAA